MSIWAAHAVANPPSPYVPGDQKDFALGVTAFDAKDYKRAFAIFSRLADDDDIAARRNVALMERRGLGMAKNPEAAIKDYKIAAEAGLPTAAADLGEMLLDGEAGPARSQGGAALASGSRRGASSHCAVPPGRDV